MKKQYKILIQTIFIFLMVVSPLKTTTICVYIPVSEEIKSFTFEEHCLLISERLNQLGYLSVKSEEFAEFIWKVSYCESNHKTKARNGDQLGLWQMTALTRKKLGVKHGGLQVQANNYFKFLAAGGKKLRLIKSSVDLHCYNFAPANFTKDTLSRVSNEGLKALDINRDSVITKEDLRLFQKRRLKV